MCPHRLVVRTDLESLPQGTASGSPHFASTSRPKFNKVDAPSLREGQQVSQPSPSLRMLVKSRPPPKTAATPPPRDPSPEPSCEPSISMPDSGNTRRAALVNMPEPSRILSASTMHTREGSDRSFSQPVAVTKVLTKTWWTYLGSRGGSSAVQAENGTQSQSVVARTSSAAPGQPATSEKPDSSPSISVAINSTPLRRFAVLVAIKILKHFRPRSGDVLFLTDKICVKYGSLVQISEASTVQFIAKHTSIPVPKVHCAFVHNGWAYVVMERIDGEMLAQGWLSRSPESKAKILAQLKKIVTEMRGLPAPNPSVANVVGGPLYDSRFPGTSLTVGPFKTIRDFHIFLRNGLEMHPPDYPEVGKMMTLQDQPWPMPVFTHGDLSSLNILVRGEDVVGIVDWETAGWYPSYWEYTVAWCQVNPRNYFWREEIDQFLDPMPQELEMEMIRLKYFGDV